MDDMDSAPQDSGDARRALAEVTGLRRHTRRARQAFWFPLIVFGLLTLAAATQYVQPRPPQFSNTDTVITVSSHGRQISHNWYNMLGGFQANAPSIALFWLIGIPTAYVMTAVFYLWWSHRRGVSTNWRLYALSGTCAFALLTCLTWAWRVLPDGAADLLIRGALPLVSIAAGFGVLALVDRSIALGAVSAGLLGLAFTANLYDMENITYRLGLHRAAGTAVNVYIFGGVLLLAGIVFGLVEARAAVQRIARSKPLAQGQLA